MEKIDKEVLKDITILFVEDDAATLEEIAYFLQKYVKKLYIAKNGVEGLELFKEHRPDMVISDIQMPKMNGLDMSEKILQIDPSVPIALTTAYSDSKYLIKAIELGIDKYIIKPINMYEMMAVIQKSLLLKKEKLSSVNNSDYLEFILDNTSTFMFIVHSSQIEYVNQKLLDTLGFDNLESLNNKLIEHNEVLEFEDIKNNENWLEYITSNNDEKYLVYLKNQETFFKRKFFLKYRYFESVNRAVFILIDSNEEKLERIQDVTLKLLDKLDEGISSNILMDELKGILQIAKKD